MDCGDWNFGGNGSVTCVRGPSKAKNINVNVRKKVLKQQKMRNQRKNKEED